MGENYLNFVLYLSYECGVSYSPYGVEILSPVYDKIYDEYLPENTSKYQGIAKYNFILVEKDEKKYFMNLQGKCIKDCP